jgi:hypothetical protein
MGTRDPDEAAAAWAYDALGARSKLRLSESRWYQLASSARMALQAGVILRRSAAAAVTRLLSRAPRGEAASRVSEIQRAYAQDICYLVRRVADYSKGNKQPAGAAAGR